MLCALVLSAATLLVARAPAASAGAEAGLDVHLGFDGIVKIGVPVPLRVGVPPLPWTGRAALIVDAPALGPQAGTVTVSTVVPFDAVAGAPRNFNVPVVLSDIRRPPAVRLLIAGREVLRRTIAVDPTRVGGRVVVTLAAEPVDLAFLHRLPGRVTAGTATPELLPRLWQEYGAVDLLVVHDLDQARVDDAQREALLTWLRLGGRLLVIPRPGAPVPGFLDPVLPAAIGEFRSLPALSALAARYGGGLPPGPFPAAALVARPGARLQSAGGVPIVAAGPAGQGWVTVWAFDPAAPPFQAWPGRLALWAEAVGSPAAPLVDVAAAAAHLPRSTPLDPSVHVEVGLAILLYIAALYGARRRFPTVLGAVAGVVLACAGIGVFAVLAASVRDRATTLTQVTFLEQAPGTGMARATTVAAVAVPYGGPFHLWMPRDSITAPVAAAGDLRITRTGGATALTGRLRQGEGARALYAVGAARARASGWLADGGRTLTVDLGGEPLRHAALRWRGRIYPLGDLAPGVSTQHLLPDQWSRSPDVEGDDLMRAWIFRGEGGDVIMDAATPVLVGEAAHAAPAFSLAGGRGRSQQVTILLVPLSSPRTAETRSAPGTPKQRR